MAETKHKLILSTTESNYGINLIRIRQGDVQTQKLVVEIVEHSMLKTFDGLVPFFINTTKFSENQPVEQKVQEYSPSQARLVYTLSEPDWQWVGENTAHFSFRSLNGDGTWSEQFSTQDFTYRVISGITRSNLRDSGYVWTFEDLLRKFRDYMSQGEKDWERWIEDNREILESVDPGGMIITILNDAKGDYDSLSARLEEIQYKVFSVPTGSDQVLSGLVDSRFNLLTGEYDKIIPSRLETVIRNVNPKHFNVAFITDTHVEKQALSIEGIDPKNFELARRWNSIRRFQELGKVCDVSVYGGDNANCHSGRIHIQGDVTIPEGRTHALSLQKRFVALATVGKKNVILCRGNHDTGKIPYAWYGHNPQTCLNGADMKKLYNGTYGGKIFEEKGVAIYRIDTDDYSDALDGEGNYIEFSGAIQNGAVGKISGAQLKDLGEFLLHLDRRHHVLLVGHIPLENSATGVWNTDALQQLLDGFKQGSAVTIDYDQLKGKPVPGYTGRQTFDFSQGKESCGGTIIGYVCGHWHYDTARDLGTTKIIVCTCAFSSDETVSPEDYSAFCHIAIDKDNRRLRIKGVGRSTDRTFTY